MRIGILFNCQNLGLAHALRALLPSAEIHTIGLTPEMRDPAAAQAVLQQLAACQHVITYQIGHAYGPLQTAKLQRAVPTLHILPAITFSGFHPDMIYVQTEDRSPLIGITGDYHSRIALIGYLAGLPPAETATLYNRLIFQKLGYLTHFAEAREILRDYFAQHELDLAPHFQSWLATGCFMHSMNHPKTAPLLSLAHIACARMGITPENPGVTPDQLPDTLANHAHHPVFPAIAANAGVPPEPLFTTAQTRHANRRILAPEEFIQASYQAFATVPREHLLAAEGAAAGLKTLRL